MVRVCHYGVNYHALEFMKTIVIQSCSTPASGWMNTCLDSVRAWANVRGFEYRFIDDAIFDYVPDWYMNKVAGKLPVATDYARLVLLQQALDDEGFEQAIWLDADVLVLDQAMTIKHEGSCAFGQEVWVQRDKKGHLRAKRNVHNAVCSFYQNCPVLPFLIHTVESLVRRVDSGFIPPQFVGPKLLNALHPLADFSLLPQIGALSPLVVDDVLAAGGKALQLMLNEAPVTLQAVNLCASVLPEDKASTVIERLRNISLRPLA